MWGDITGFPRQANQSTIFQWALFLVALGFLLYIVHWLAGSLPG